MSRTSEKKRKELEEFKEEQRYHRREWLTQRIGWGLLTALLIAGCAGVFGKGPLADKKVAIGDSTLEFERFARRRATTQWKLSPAESAVVGDEIVVRMSSLFVEDFEVQTMIPEPSSIALERDNTVFRFKASDARGSIVFHVEPDSLGLTEGIIQVGEGHSAALAQFIYP